MVTAVALALYALALAAAAVVVWRRPVAALYAFVVALAVHNAAGAALFGLGVRGSALTAILAWKEILLAVALARVARDALRSRALPFRVALPDVLALAFAVVVVVYALLPQSLLGGHADRHAIGLALKHDLVPVGAYFLGRSVVLAPRDARRLAWTVVAAATVVAGVGLVEVYAVPIGWWRSSSVPAYFRDQLGYDYHGTGGLPENFIFNTGSEKHFLRRLVSFFLSPLATSYMLVVALLVAATLRRTRLLAVAAVVLAGGLLWTFSRASVAALAVGLCVLALVRRRAWPVAAAVAAVAVGVAFAHVFPSIAPRGHWTKADIAYQRKLARQHPGASGSATSANESSARSHWASLKAGIRTDLRHPQGYGLGNVGTTAARSGETPLVGESNYTELAAETGLVGGVLWIAWGLSVLVALVVAARREAVPLAAALAAAFAAILALAIQTDVIGDPWVAYCVWALGGATLAPIALVARVRAAEPSSRRWRSTRASTSATST